MVEQKMIALRHIRVPTPRVVGLATQDVEVTRANLLFENDKVEVGLQCIPQRVVNLYEKAGIETEYFSVTRQRGRKNIYGTQVRVSPLNQISYKSGALIKVFEDDHLSSENTNKILEVLLRHKIDWDKECELWEGQRCLIKTL